MTAKVRRVQMAAVLVAALTLVSSACSSNGSSKTSSTSGNSTHSTTPNANAALLGPMKQATGSPLKVGFIYDGQTQSIDTRPELAIAQATVKYVNEHLGGVGGHSLELVACAANASPSGSTDCANQMIAAKVPAVLSTAPAQPAAIIGKLGPAKIPFLMYAGIDQSVLLSPDSYVITNPLATLAIPIKVAKDNGTKKAAMVYIDLPAAAQIKAIATPLFNKQGISVSFVAVPPGTPDMTPQIQSAISAGAQQLSIVGNTAFCISALKAAKTLGFSGKIIINTECLSPDIAKTVPGGTDGVEVSSNESQEPSDREVALYNAVAAQYAPGTPPHEAGNSGGYAAVIGFVRGMSNLTAGNVTPATVASTFASMSPQPMPLLAGQTFKCDHKTPLLPAACSSAAVVLTLDASGNVKSSQAFDAAPYIKLG